MKTFSTRQAAEKLGIGIATLTRYIQAGRVPAPKITNIGKLRVRMWSKNDIERVRKLLPKIANGRKLRYKKARKMT
jgi:predicted site-specific integrase-resolvase